MAQELERVRRLAKAWAQVEQTTAGIYLNDDGTYGFGDADESDKSIIEYITPY